MDIPKGTTHVLYGGNLWGEKRKAELYQKANRTDLTEDQREAISKYRYGFRYCDQVVDIPPEYGDTSKFRSTLGHKTNHKFVDTNVAFSHTDSARFGMIASMTTTRDIKKDEEFFLHYGYGIGPGAPRWYMAQYEQLIKDRPELDKGLLGKKVTEGEEEQGVMGAGGGGEKDKTEL